MSTSEGVSSTGGRNPEELASQVRLLEAEVSDLRRRLDRRARPARAALELRLADTQRSLAGLTSQNERLAQTLREARDQIMKLKEEVDRLAQPPAGFGTFLARNDDDSIDVFTGGRKLRVNVSPERRPRRTSSVARRSCSTRRSTSSPPSTSRRSARS